MQAVIGGNLVYPNLQGIADLFRVKINDTFNNSGGSGTGYGGGAGLIMPNSNPDLLTIMVSGIEDLYSDLRNVGDPELILDNYIITGIPALTAVDPALQVALGFNGYFDGYQWHPDLKLPIGLRRTMALWERWTNSGDDFAPMNHAAFGLPGVAQGNRMGRWEQREDKIWMPGSLVQTDIRIRGRLNYQTPKYSPTLNFNTTYVPIMGCTNAVVAKMCSIYSSRFAPDMKASAMADEELYMGKLRLEIVRQMQTQENQRAEFGAEAVQDFAISWSWL